MMLATTSKVFSFKDGPQKRLPFNKPPRTSFLDFSAEMRKIVYRYAVVVPFVIRNGVILYKNDRKRRDRITACFTFMRTCRQVYEEASPMFWEFKVFLRNYCLTNGLGLFHMALHSLGTWTTVRR